MAEKEDLELMIAEALAGMRKARAFTLETYVTFLGSHRWLVWKKPDGVWAAGTSTDGFASCSVDYHSPEEALRGEVSLENPARNKNPLW